MYAGVEHNLGFVFVDGGVVADFERCQLAPAHRGSKNMLGTNVRKMRRQAVSQVDDFLVAVIGLVGFPEMGVVLIQVFDEHLCRKSGLLE